MFVSQPPCKYVVINEVAGEAAIVCKDDEGVRMGMLLDRVVELKLERDLYVTAELRDVAVWRRVLRSCSCHRCDPKTEVFW